MGLNLEGEFKLQPYDIEAFYHSLHNVNGVGSIHVISREIFDKAVRDFPNDANSIITIYK